MGLPSAFVLVAALLGTPIVAHAGAHAGGGAIKVTSTKAFDRKAQESFIRQAKRALRKAGIKARFRVDLVKLRKQGKGTKRPLQGNLEIEVKGARNVERAFKRLALDGDAGMVSWRKDGQPVVIQSQFAAPNVVQFSVGTKKGYRQYEMNLADD